MSWAKKLLFNLSGVLLAFTVIALIEISLRIFSYGETIPVFIEDKVNSTYSTLNPRLGNRYFNNNQVAPPLDFFKTQKPNNEFRIFVQGASTVVGFPYGHAIAFPKMLEHQLQKKYPDTKITIINTGLTATNTYSLLDIADAIIEQKPDAVLIYTGHNEYYGAFGVSSSESKFNSISLKRFYLSIQHYRLVQLLSNLLATGSKGKEEGTLMAKMIGNKEIVYGSEQYNDGISQFENNLNDIINKYAGNNVPVFIGTLVSNRKDLPPFNSSIINDKALLNLEVKADTLLSIGEYEKALATYLTIWKSDSSSANLSFKILKCYEHINDLNAIDKYSRYSSDLDMIRFRAPSRFNVIIKSIAREKKLNLVDLEKSFEEYTDGIIGEELISEHVHPNIKGYKLMAAEYFKSICKSGLIGVNSNAGCGEISLEDYCISSLDSIYGQLLINRLMLNWPFSSNPEVYNEIDYKPKSVLEELAFARYKNEMVWAEAHNRAYSYFMTNQMFDDAYCEAKNLKAEFPTLEMPYIMMAKSRFPTGEFEEIRNILLEAVNEVNSKQVEVLLVQILLLDKDVKMASDVVYNYYQKDSSQEHRSLYEMIARLKNIIDATSQDGLIQNSPEFYEVSLIFRELGIPQAMEIYVNKSN